MALEGRALSAHRTGLADNFDSRRDEIERVLRKVHGDAGASRMRRWRWFLLATAGLFDCTGGSEWGVSHYRLKAVALRIVY